MSRPKEFDREAALDRAIELFWSRGFEGTSIRDIVEATGVQKQSLYDTFGDKQALYLAALHHYLAQTDRTIAKLNDTGPSTVTILRGVLHGLATATCSGPRGCMLVQAVGELGPHDPAIGQLAHTNVVALEKALAGLLRRGQSRGEIREDVSPRGAARMLITIMWGARSLGRGGVDEPWLRSALDHVLGTVAAPKT